MMQDELKVIGVNQKGYGIIPKLVMQDETLNISAKGLYAYFCSFAGSGCTCFPTRSKMCHDLGISNETLGKYLKELAARGYISFEQVKENGRFSHNVYTLNPTISPYAKKPDTENMDTIINSPFKSNSSVNTPIAPKGGARAKEITDLFCAICTGLPKPKKMPDSRRKAILAADKEITEAGGWEQFFQLVADNSFLNGDNDRHWVASFDWILKPANRVKIIEGNYKGRKEKPVEKDYSEEWW